MQRDRIGFAYTECMYLLRHFLNHLIIGTVSYISLDTQLENLFSPVLDDNILTDYEFEGDMYRRC